MSVVLEYMGMYRLQHNHATGFLGSFLKLYLIFFLSKAFYLFSGFLYYRLNPFKIHAQRYGLPHSAPFNASFWGLETPRSSKRVEIKDCHNSGREW